MRKVVLKMSMSMDGFVCGPKGEMEWMFGSRSPDSGAWVLATLREADVHLMGRGFYEQTANYWPTVSDPMGDAMNNAPKVVASRTLSADPSISVGTPFPGAGTWESPYVAGDDLAADIRRLKDQPGEVILVNGGVRFARSLIRLGLVDEYRLAVHPVALGAGRALFSDLEQPVHLERVTTAVFTGGIVAHTMVPVSDAAI